MWRLRGSALSIGERRRRAVESQLLALYRRLCGATDWRKRLVLQQRLAPRLGIATPKERTAYYAGVCKLREA